MTDLIYDKLPKSRKLRDLSDLAQNRQIEESVFRLQEVVKKAGGSKHVAALCEIPLSTFSGYLAGREMKLSVAQKISEICDVTLEWLATGIDKNNSNPQIVKKEVDSDKGLIKTIPGYDMELSAGYGFSPNTSIEQVSFSISSSVLPPELLSPHRKLIGVRARGDSMEPYITSGDILALDLNDCEIFTGGIYGLRIGDQLLVKRLSLRANGNLIVSSDNPRYPSDELNAQEMRQMMEDGGSPMAIIGRIVWRMGMATS